MIAVTWCTRAEDLPARVSGVLAVLFLVFNEGYLATGPDNDPVRDDLTAEAIRLTRMPIVGRVHFRGLAVPL